LAKSNTIYTYLFKIDIEKIEKLATTSGLRFGELKLKPLAKTKFVGYGPKFTDDPSSKEWINTGYHLFILWFLIVGIICKIVSI
jgi:hypothetical protein